MRIRNCFILLICMSMILVTGCSGEDSHVLSNSVKEDYGKLADKYFEEEDYNNAEKYYKMALEEKEELDLYMKLANTYNEQYEYDKENFIINQAKESLGESRELNFRSGKVRAIMGERLQAIGLLSKELEKEYDEEILRELLKIYNDEQKFDQIINSYGKYKEDIEDIRIEILVYEIMSPDNGLFADLEENLMNSNNADAYEVLMKKAYGYGDYEKLEKLITRLKSVEGGNELANLYSALLKMKDYEILGTQVGYFTSMDKKDMTLLYRGEENHSDFFLGLIDGEDGDLKVFKMDEDFYPDFVDLDIYREKGELDKLAMTCYYGMSAASGKSFKLFEIKNEGYKEIEIDFKDDVEIKLLEDFQIQIESESLNIKYTIDIPREDRESYIEDGQYNWEGVPFEDQTRVYADGFYIKSRKGIKDTIVVDLGFGGAYRYSADRLGQLEKSYNMVDGELKCTNFSVGRIEGLEEGTSTFGKDGRTIVMSQSEDIGQVNFPEYLIEEDFILTIGDKTIDVDEDIDSIAKSIGAGEIEFQEEINEYATMYSYKNQGLSIYYIENNSPEGRKLFNEVILVEESGIKTRRGLQVGMDEEDLEKAYGLDNMFFEDDDEIIYAYTEDYASDDLRHMDLFVVVDKRARQVIRFNYATNI